MFLCLLTHFSIKNSKKWNKFEPGTFFFSLSFSPNVVCSYLLIFFIVNASYPHARSTYTLSKETDFCFLSFSFQNQASKSCQGESNSFADSTGTHSSRGSSLTSPRSERAPVLPLGGVKHVHTRGLCILLFYYCFFCRLCSYF